MKKTKKQWIAKAVEKMKKDRLAELAGAFRSQPGTEHATADSVIRAHVDAEMEDVKKALEDLKEATTTENEELHDSITSSLRLLPTRELMDYKLKKMKEAAMEEWKKELERLEEQLKAVQADLATLTEEVEEAFKKAWEKRDDTSIICTDGSEGSKHALTRRSSRRSVLCATY